MHRCNSGSHSACTCGYFNTSSTTNSFSMLFSSPHPFDHSDPYSMASSSSSSSSSVDCTLSLGTPSTRQTNDVQSISNHQGKSTSFMSNLCSWNAFQTKQTTQKSSKGSCSNAGGGGGGGGVINTLNGDPLVPRRCTNCETTSTPLWRNGPRGPKSLCNACGIRYKKEERRATNPTIVTGAAPTILESQHRMNHHHSWKHHQSSALGKEFRFINDEENNVPFLSWRLNVTDRPSLVHDYTLSS